MTRTFSRSTRPWRWERSNINSLKESLNFEVYRGVTSARAALLNFARMQVVVSARSGRRFIPPLRSAKICSAWNRGCWMPSPWQRRCEHHSFRARVQRCLLDSSDLFHASIWMGNVNNRNLLYLKVNPLNGGISQAQIFTPAFGSLTLE